MNATVLAAIRTRRGTSKARLKRPPVWLRPRNAERKYEADLASFADDLGRDIRSKIEPMIAAWIAEAQGNMRADSWPDQISRLIDTLKTDMRTMADRNFTPSFDLAKETADYNRSQWKKTVKAVVGVDVLSNEPWLADHLKSFAYTNAELIRNSGEKLITDVSTIVRSGVVNGRRHEEIAKDLYGKIEATRSHVRFIARDQVSKLNGELTELRQGTLGITEYVWRTSKDDRVRETHRSKEGKTFQWDKPPNDTGHPGHDYQCRCWAEPVFNDIAADLDVPGFKRKPAPVVPVEPLPVVPVPAPKPLPAVVKPTVVKPVPAPAPAPKPVVVPVKPTPPVPKPNPNAYVPFVQPSEQIKKGKKRNRV